MVPLTWLLGFTEGLSTIAHIRPVRGSISQVGISPWTLNSWASGLSLKLSGLLRPQRCQGALLWPHDARSAAVSKAAAGVKRSAPKAPRRTWGSCRYGML